MPLPKPNPGETKEEFLNRCMGNDTMNEEFPDSKQRYAVCLNQWKSKEKDSVLMIKENRVNSNSGISVVMRKKGKDEKAKQRPVIEGHAAVFNQLSEFLGFGFEFQEIILPGAFQDVLDNDVRALFNHDDNMVLGRTTNGTLQLSEDEKGLFVRIFPPNTQLGRDLIKSIRRKDITQMSFAFTIDMDGDVWMKDEETGNVIRMIKRVKQLYDVSPVTFPAYPQTDVNVHSYNFDYKYIGYLGYKKLGLVETKETIEKELEKISVRHNIRKKYIDLLEMD